MNLTHLAHKTPGHHDGMTCTYIHTAGTTFLHWGVCVLSSPPPPPHWDDWGWPPLQTFQSPQLTHASNSLPAMNSLFLGGDVGEGGGSVYVTVYSPLESVLLNTPPTCAIFLNRQLVYITTRHSSSTALSSSMCIGFICLCADRKKPPDKSMCCWDCVSPPPPSTSVIAGLFCLMVS